MTRGFKDHRLIGLWICSFDVQLKIWHKKLNGAPFKQKRIRCFGSIATKNTHHYWKHIKRYSASFFISEPSSRYKCQCEIVLMFLHGTDKYWKLNRKYKNIETKANQMHANTCAHYILALFHTECNVQQKWTRFKFFRALPTLPSTK